MFAGSYDSLGYDDQRKHHSPPQRPRKDYNTMTQQERARRETNRRRREQMELMLLGSEEGMPMMAGVRRHCSEPMMHCSNETMMRQKYSRHDFHHHDESILPRGSSKSLFLRDETDGFGNIITPPTIIYARGVSASQDEMDRDIENHTALKSSIAIRSVQPDYMQQQQQQQQQQNDDGQIRSSTYVMLQEKSEFMIEQHKETSSGNETKKDMKEEQQPQPILMDVDIVHNQEEEDENS